VHRFAIGCCFLKVALFKHQITGLGGAERVIAEYMRRSKHEVVLFTDRIEKGALRWFSGEHLVEIAPSKQLQLFEKLHPLIIKFPLDEVDVLVPFIGEILSEMVIVRNNSIPVIGYLQGIFRFVDLLEQRFKFREGTLTPLAKTYGLVLSRIFDNYNVLVTNSNFVKYKLRRWVKLMSNDKVRVIHPGVDTSIFKPAGVYDNYFLVVSRIEPLKRLELIIHAFALFKNICGHKFGLVIAGYLNSQNQSYLNYLTNLCKKNVDFIINPSDEDLLKLYQTSYAFVFSSFQEPFGITPLEAMSCGRPVIVAGEGGFLDYLRDGVNGLLAKGNPQDFARKMVELTCHPELTEKMGMNARRTALRYDWRKFTSQMDALVERVLK